MNRSTCIALGAALASCAFGSFITSSEASAATQWRRISPLQCKVAGQITGNYRTDGSLAPGGREPEYDFNDIGACVAAVSMEFFPLTSHYLCPIPYDSYFPIQSVATLNVYYTGPVPRARACRSYFSASNSAWYTCGAWKDGANGVVQPSVSAWAGVPGSAYVDFTADDADTTLRGVYVEN